MTTDPATVSQSTTASPVPVARRTTLSPRRPWLLGALLLAGAAQLITISALLSVDPLAVTWWSLLLAIAPAPVATVAAFAPATLARAATAAAIVIVVVGIVTGVLHTGLFFLPALAALVVGGRALLREQS